MPKEAREVLRPPRNAETLEAEEAKQTTDLESKRRRNEIIQMKTRAHQEDTPHLPHQAWTFKRKQPRTLHCCSSVGVEEMEGDV
jgi:hypothetical protein